MRKTLPFSMLRIWFAGVFLTGCCLAIADEPVHQTVTLRGAPELSESSGLAFSTRDASCVWTHNDSGGGAVLFCFDSDSGKLTGRCELKDASAIDWESMTTGRPGRHELIVADCGDNLARRNFITLYRFAEPNPRAQTTIERSDYETLDVRFPDGPVDCEAVWYDPGESRIVLLAKGRLPLAGVFTITDEQWSAEEKDEENASRTRKPVTARYLATIGLPMITGADRNPSNGDVWVASYFQAFCFRRGDFVRLDEQMKQIPLAFEMPPLRQIESISLDSDSHVWVTSEGAPAILVRCQFD